MGGLQVGHSAMNACMNIAMNAEHVGFTCRCW